MNEDWTSILNGLHASFGSIDTRYCRSEIPQIQKNNEWTGVAWRGEKISAQIVLWSKETVKGIRFEFTNFEDKYGEKLSSRIGQTRFVRYVLTDEFGSGDGCADRKPGDFHTYLSPDILDTILKFDKDGNTTRPVWITIDIPRDTKPGEYSCKLLLYAEETETQVFFINLEVQLYVLPPPGEWEFHLDLWQHPYAVARMYGVRLWSDEHWELMRPLMKMLADAGQKVITTTVNEDPWGGQAFDAYGSMIEWRKRCDGTWEFDYSVFDKWVEFMMEIGVTKQINAYSLIPWTSELVYFDEAKDRKVTEKIKTGSPEYVELWSPFIKDFRTHLEKKNWLSITNLAMDEIKVEPMQSMLVAMDEIAPEFGLASADSEKAYKKFPDRIRDLTVTYAVIIDRPDLEYRKSKGYLTTFYVCCREPYPNQFTFSPPVESAFMGWYSIAKGFDGFLRWAYTHWVEDPLHDTRFRKWPAGDTNFVYPGPRSSIRFERLVEGIQDAEKIMILRKNLQLQETVAARKNLEKLEKMMDTFPNMPTQDEIPGIVLCGKKIINDISRTCLK